MTQEMPKTYAPQQWEEKLYEWWESMGFFQPEQQIESGLADPALPPFVIAMPPPNVTGALHLGHFITSSIQDMLIRYHRMAGRPTLWVPGTDHAGIATQNVVERKLEEGGVTRHDLGRERFVQEVWDWKDEYHGQISGQQRRMGISCDWSRERFTLDDGLSDAVLEAFIRLYNDGLIYRGNYLVNWCPRCESAISDLEVEHEPIEGKLYTFRYPLRETSAGADMAIEGRSEAAVGHVEVSTTRPETILGDTAVAVHPDDVRYAHLIGRTAVVPMLEREIPIIADEHVDPAFGTGALKVTPGHDPSDYQIARRHDLPFINITNEDGSLNPEAGPYEGLDRFDAREKLWEDMRAAGLVIRETAHTHEVGHCERCHTIVEPLQSTQWFVKMKPLAEPAIDAVRNGRIKIVPARFEKNYFHWMENIRDWCISRQLWWGHRIPIWYGPDGHQFAARSESEALEQAIEQYGETVELEQDADVLDTWFSSGLWPFSTLGWPGETDAAGSEGQSAIISGSAEDLARYYPTSVLETGYDILFFWVARMIMLGVHFTGEAPFRHVYLHGLVRAEDGRKMSKSLGNALDPLDLISRYGNDALRFTLLTGSTPGNDMKLSISRIEANRNFANKIWNAARFVLLNLETASDIELGNEKERHSVTFALPPISEQTLADRWILSRLNTVQAHVTQLVASWQLGEAGRQLHEFLWSEYCDWYIEAAKPRLYGDDQGEAARATCQVLAYVLEQSLRLLHPFMPYVTEAIWSHLPGVSERAEALMTQRWPCSLERKDAAAEEAFGRVQEIVRAIRTVRAQYNVEPGRRIAATFHVDSPEHSPGQEQIAGNESAYSVNGSSALVHENLELLTNLARLDEAQVAVEADAAQGRAVFSAGAADSAAGQDGRAVMSDSTDAGGPAILLAAGGITTCLPLTGMVDLEAERRRLGKELADIERQIARAEGLLNNEKFVSKAPERVVQRERDKLKELQTRQERIAESLAQLRA